VTARTSPSRVIGAQIKATDANKRYAGRRFFVADLLLQTARGPAAIDHHESAGLSARDHVQLTSAIAARGGRRADESELRER
jgi:hypothetical protein